MDKDDWIAFGESLLFVLQFCATVLVFGIVIELIS